MTDQPNLTDNAGEAGWRPISSLPAELQDGREVRVKRLHRGWVVKEGMAVFAVPHPASPMRSMLGPDPLGRMSSTDYAREASDREKMLSAPMWLNPDRMYCFPEPTHWMPLPAAPALDTAAQSSPGMNQETPS